MTKKCGSPSPALAGFEMLYMGLKNFSRLEVHLIHGLNRWISAGLL